MKFEGVKHGISIIPATDEDKRKFSKVGQGEIVLIEFDRKRNTKFHRKFFKLLSIGFENQERFLTPESYRENVLIMIDWCESSILDNGHHNFKAKSISYEKLPDNNEFEEVYNKAVEYIANKLSITNEELTNEILSNF